MFTPPSSPTSQSALPPSNTHNESEVNGRTFRCGGAHVRVQLSDKVIPIEARHLLHAIKNG